MLYLKEQTDAELFEKYLSGDERAFAAFYTRHAFDLWKLILSVVHDVDAADDVMQEAFMILHSRRTTQMKGCDPRSFLRKIAFNAALGHLRQAGRWRANIPSTSLWDKEGKLCDIVGTKENIEQELAVNEERLKVAAVLNDLEVIYRQALVNHYMEGMSYRDMAEFWEVAAGTVRGRLQAAMDQFKTAYEDYVHAEHA